jgi:HMG-box domain
MEPSTNPIDDDNQRDLQDNQRNLQPSEVHDESVTDADIDSPEKPNQNDDKENDVDEDDLDDNDVHEESETPEETVVSPTDNAATNRKKQKHNNGRADNELMRFADSIRVEEEKETDPEILAQIDLIVSSTPTTDLEIALTNAMKRKTVHLNRLTAEIFKLKNFISKRKQTYKRKRKDDSAPTRALSAYNIFIQDRFHLLAKENEKALRSENEDMTLQRVPPSHLVAATGNVWKTLSLEEKQKYEERCVTFIEHKCVEL